MAILEYSRICSYSGIRSMEHTLRESVPEKEYSDPTITTGVEPTTFQIVVIK